MRCKCWRSLRTNNWHPLSKVRGALTSNLVGLDVSVCLIYNSSMLKYFVIIVVLAFGAYKLKGRFFPRYAPSMVLSSSEGEKLAFSPTSMKPTLVTFWITDCPYSSRALKILSNVRASIPKEKLNILGLYLNPADAKQLKTMKNQLKIPFSIATFQDDIDNTQKIFDSFGPLGTGTTIYLVDQKGKIHRVDAYADPDRDAARIEADVFKLLKSKARLTKS